MKRHLLSFMLPLLALAACEKPFEEQEIPQSQTGETIEFTATMEQIGGDTKTALGPDLDILWQKGDEIFLCDKRREYDIYHILDSEAGKTQAIFNDSYPGFPIERTPIDHFVAFSPIIPNYSLLCINGNGYTFVDFVLPEKQKYVENSYDPTAFPMIAVSETQVLPFKNAAGILKLRIKGTSVVKNIVLSTSKTITGKTSITSDAVLTLTGEGGKNSILMDCGETGVQLNETTATAFHFVLPPVDLSDGFTVEIVDNANGHMVIKAPSGLQGNKIERNQILSMPEFTYKPVSAAPVPAANEIVVRMADPEMVPPDVYLGPECKKIAISDSYWKYVFKADLEEICASFFDSRTINFEEMILPEGLVNIKETAFKDQNVNDNNYYLKKIVLPTTLKTIGNQAFENSRALEEIVFNDPERSQLESIGTDAFRNCQALRAVALPNNAAVKSFVFSGFRDCKNLASINIPDNTTTIGIFALKGTALKTLTIPEGVTTLEENAFEGMTQLETAVIPERVTVIPGSLFILCSNLTSLTLPSTVKTIGGTFIYGTKITSLDLPEGLEEIAENAFLESQLTSFTIPSTVKTIGLFAIQSNNEFTLTVKAPVEVKLDGWHKNFVSGNGNCNLILHSSRQEEVDMTCLKWRGIAWWKSIKFIDDSGKVVNPQPVQ